MTPKITILAADSEIHYIKGLIYGLSIFEVNIDLITNSDYKDKNYHNVNVLNLRGDRQKSTNTFKKVKRIISYYTKLYLYIFKTDSKIFHIQSISRFESFDRTILLFVLKILGKKIIYTFHDISQKKIISSQWNSKNEIEIRLIDKIIIKVMKYFITYSVVHNNNIKKILEDKFNFSYNKINIIPHGINILFNPNIISKMEARKKFNLNKDNKTILFFGNISANKGLDLLIKIVLELLEMDNKYFLLIGGNPRKGNEEYLKNIIGLINSSHVQNIKYQLSFIHDEEIPYFFKAADCIVLPYKTVYQSGVLYLAYSFGIPVIASNVGNFNEEIIENKTGFLFQVNSSSELKGKIITFFNSDLYKCQEKHAQEIYYYARNKYSWESIGEKYYNLYNKCISKR